MCGWAWGSLCEGLAVSPATPQSWLWKRRIPRWPSAPTADTQTHWDAHTALWAPWQLHSWEQWRPIAGIQRTPHNCLTEKPKLLMGTTLIFPFLKEAFFPPLSLISKCLVFQNAHCVSDGLLWIKAFSADNKWFKCASHYSGLQRQKYVATMRANRIIQLITSGSYRWCLCVCASHTWCSRRSRCCRCSLWWSSRRWRPGTLCHTVPAWSDPSSELRGGKERRRREWARHSARDETLNHPFQNQIIATQRVTQTHG